jgi:hypothetical protein
MRLIDLISRQAAIDAMYMGCYLTPKDRSDLVKALERLPTIDAVEVVRCKECKMANSCSDDREMYCTLNHCYKRNNYFCADGRRTNE